MLILAAFGDPFEYTFKWRDSRTLASHLHGASRDPYVIAILILAFAITLAELILVDVPLAGAHSAHLDACQFPTRLKSLDPMTFVS